MFYLISFHFLDLRFFITRPFEEDTRDPWLKPRWLWPDSGYNIVGRLGPGVPIPGRPRPGAASRSASVDGGKMLQTQSEAAAKKIDPAAGLGGFRIHAREIVADGSGQVRFDLLLEKPLGGQAPGAVLEEIFALELAAPLRAQSVALGDAPELIAGIYESESIKTSSGGADPASKAAALAAAANTVALASDAPNVVLIDLKGEFDPKPLAPVAACTAPCRADLRLLTGDIAGAPTLLWHLQGQLQPGAASPAPAGGDAPLPEEVWSAAFDLSGLVGRIHELSIFKDRVDRLGAAIQPDLARLGIAKRNGQFAEGSFGGWDRHKVLAAAVSALWLRQGRQNDILEQISTFAASERDVKGFKSNVTYVTNIAGNYGEVTLAGGDIFSGITNSIVSKNSILENVHQTIGSLPNADQATKDELTKLLADLEEQLKAVPAEKAKLVAKQASDLLDEAQKPAADKSVLQFAIDGLKRAADLVKETVPSVVTIATGIAGLIAKLHGIPL